MKTKLLLTVLATATTVSAHSTGECGHKFMGHSPAGVWLWTLLGVGIVLLVWLHNIKLWKELFDKKR